MFLVRTCVRNEYKVNRKKKDPCQSLTIALASDTCTRLRTYYTKCGPPKNTTPLNTRHTPIGELGKYKKRRRRRKESLVTIESGQKRWVCVCVCVLLEEQSAIWARGNKRIIFNPLVSLFSAFCVFFLPTPSFAYSNLLVDVYWWIRSWRGLIYSSRCRGSHLGTPPRCIYMYARVPPHSSFLKGSCSSRRSRDICCCCYCCCWSIFQFTKEFMTFFCFFLLSMRFSSVLALLIRLTSVKGPASTIQAAACCCLLSMAKKTPENGQVRNLEISPLFSS